MATATLKNNGKSIKLQLLGSLEALTDTERAEIQALLDALISETDEEWLETLAGYDIAAKIRFLQLSKGNILNSIMNKGVEIPDTQPFRTIFQLIDAIGSGGGGVGIGQEMIIGELAFVNGVILSELPPIIFEKEG